jgi:hypothetical protein
MAATQLNLIEATESATGSNPAEADLDLWAIYYPDKTPEQAYSDARVDYDRWYDLYKAVQDVVATYSNCETDEDRAAYWKRLAAAQTQLLRHSGVPECWIDRYGHEGIPAGVCRECWKPGAVDIDECGGCDQHYHPACHRAMSIRCDLRSVRFAQMQGDGERAAFWMRIAIAKHKETL